MGKYFIVTESGADLPQSVKNRPEVYALPMHVSIEGIDYLDDGSLPIEELCAYYDNSKKVPTTSAVNPDEYAKAFKEINEENPDAEILHIGYSSVVSSSFQNAIIAAEGFNNIHHIDTLNVSAGQGLIVMKALELIDEGEDSQSLISQIKDYAKRTKFVFIPGNLDYLRAGGRVSNAQYLGAALLKIKPLIEIIEGKLISTKKFRGSMINVAKEVVKDYFTRFNIDPRDINFIITNRLSEEIISAALSSLKEFGAEKINRLETGCVITSHAGPGGFGIAGFEKI